MGVNNFYYIENALINMKRYSLILLCYLLILGSCKQTTKSDEKANQAKQNVEKNPIDTIGTADRYFNFQNTSIQTDFYDTVFQTFSDENAEDCFTFYMPSGNINDTKCTIKIRSRAGELIYEKTFTTSDLVNGYSTYKISSDLEMEEYVLWEAKKVLTKTSFLDINNDDENNIINSTTKEDIQDYETFVECREENRPLFCIALHEEDITIIGFSKKKNKVVDLIYCC